MNCCPVCDKKLAPDASRCDACATDLRFFQTLNKIPQEVFLQAQNAEGKGNWAQAIGYYQMARQLDPKNPESLRRIACLLQKEKKTQEAIAAWQELTVMLPKDEQARTALKTLLWASQPLHKRYLAAFGKWLAPAFGLLALVLVFVIYSFYPASSSDYVPSPSQYHSKGEGDLLRNSSQNTPMLPSPKTGQKKIEELAKELQPQLPGDLSVKPVGNGLKLTGELYFPWEKTRLERMAERWNADLVDLTSVGVRYPRAFKYKVNQGDTLMRLSRVYLGNSERWQEIYDINREHIPNPDQLTVGMSLIIHQVGENQP